ncbi:hypothetical protein [Herbaspirillum huttiense]|uniref:hypothetical protein n=1 Tax=Herbaspirillum huttiense TaxID=863372 RepID=UPI0039B00EF6
MKEETSPAAEKAGRSLPESKHMKARGMLFKQFLRKPRKSCPKWLIGRQQKRPHEEKVRHRHARRRAEEDNIASIPPFLIRATLAAFLPHRWLEHRHQAAPASLEELF